MNFKKPINKGPVKAEKKEVKSRHWRRFFLIGLSLLVIVAVYLVYLYLQRPGQGVILESKSETVPGEEKAYGKKRFDGKYVSIEYGSSFEVKMHETDTDKNRVVLEKAFLSEGPSLAKKIALTVENLQGRTLEDSANYNLRKKYPRRFQEERFKAGDINGVAFTDKNSDLFEKTIFIPQAKYLVEISLTALRPANDKLDRELDEIVGSLVSRNSD